LTATETATSNTRGANVVALVDRMDGTRHRGCAPGEGSSLMAPRWTSRKASSAKPSGTRSS